MERLPPHATLCGLGAEDGSGHAQGPAPGQPSWQGAALGPPQWRLDAVAMRVSFLGSFGHGKTGGDGGIMPANSQFGWVVGFATLRRVQTWGGGAQICLIAAATVEELE